MRYRPIRQDSDIEPTMIAIVVRQGGIRPLTKSRLMSALGRMIQEGEPWARYYDAKYKRRQELIKATFEKLVVERVIDYVPRQPLKLGAGYVPGEEAVESDGLTYGHDADHVQRTGSSGQGRGEIDRARRGHHEQTKRQSP